MEVPVGGIWPHGTRNNRSERVVGQDTERVDSIQNLDHFLDSFPELDIQELQGTAHGHHCQKYQEAEEHSTAENFATHQKYRKLLPSRIPSLRLKLN